MFNAFHFAAPVWLWGLLALPLVVAIARRSNEDTASTRLAQFADPHLLPHLLGQTETRVKRPAIWRWVAIWALGMVAMAGPQWRYTEVPVYKPARELVVLLDLSRTMNAIDVKPSRLEHARELVTDLLNANRDRDRALTVGLVAYAQAPHMVVPLTDDMATILRLLPSMDTGLITVDGDRLKPALQMAAKMLAAEPGDDKSVLVVSDGDSTDGDAPATLAAAAGGARIDTLAIGTRGGGPVPNGDGSWLTGADGKLVLDGIHADRLRALAAAGHGVAVDGGDPNAAQTLLAAMGHDGGGAERSAQTERVWDEGFYIPAIAMALLLLPGFRRRAPLLALLLIVTALPAQAADWHDWFRNPDQQAVAAVAQGDYASAEQGFADPYQQGVAAYKAGQFGRAETLFQTSVKRQPSFDALYNGGNAQLKQKKAQPAIDSYQAALKLMPGDQAAQRNLALAQQMLDQQKQEQQKQGQAKDKQADKDKDKDQGKPSDQKSGQPSDKKDDDTAKDSQSGPGQAGQGQEGKNDTGQPGQGQADAQPAQTGQDKPGKDKPGKNQAGKDQAAKGADGKPQAGQQPGAGQGKDADIKGAAKPPAPAQGVEAGDKPSDPPKGEQPGTTAPQGQAGDDTLRAGQSGSAHALSPHAAEPQAPGGDFTSAVPEGKQAASPAASSPADGHNGGKTPASLVRQEELRARDSQADRWLGHIQSDPSTFLRNQFMIEDQQSRPESDKP